MKTVSKVTMATDHDDISVSFHSASIITTAVQQIRAMFGGRSKCSLFQASKHLSIYSLMEQSVNLD